MRSVFGSHQLQPFPFASCTHSHSHSRALSSFPLDLWFADQMHFAESTKLFIVRTLATATHVTRPSFAHFLLHFCQHSSQISSTPCIPLDFPLCYPILCFTSSHHTFLHVAPHTHTHARTHTHTLSLSLTHTHTHTPPNGRAGLVGQSYRACIGSSVAPRRHQPQVPPATTAPPPLLCMAGTNRGAGRSGDRRGPPVWRRQRSPSGTWTSARSCRRCSRRHQSQSCTRWSRRLWSTRCVRHRDATALQWTAGQRHSASHQQRRGSRGCKDSAREQMTPTSLWM